MSRGRELTLVSALYLLLTAILTYPTITMLGTSIPGYGDAPRMVWDIWAFATAIIDPQVPLSTTELIFHPLPDVPTLWEGTPCLFLAVPLVLLLGPVVAYSLLFLSSFVLSGSITYLLARHLSASRIASFVAGGIFTFSGYHYAHGTGHMHLFSMQWLPLCLLCLLCLWDQPTLGRSLHLAAAMVFVVAQSPYYALYFLLPVLVCFLVYQVCRHRARLFRRRFLAGLVLALGVVAASALLVYPRLIMAEEVTAEALRRDIGDTERFSADLAAYLVPAYDHPVFGGLVAPVYRRFTGWPNQTEMTVYVGYAALLLTGWGLARGRGADRTFWALLALVGLGLSLGPVLHVNGKPLVPLPYAVLQKLPLFWTVRAPSRASVTLQLAVAVLASYGLSDLLGRIRRGGNTRMAIGAILVLCISFESLYSLPYPTSRTAVPTFYRQLSGDEKQGAILELPTGPGNRTSTAWYMLYQAYHGEELAHGYLARPHLSVDLFPHWVLRARFLSPPVALSESDNWPAFEAALADLLAYNGVRYVVIQQRAGSSAAPYSDEQYRAALDSLSRSLGRPSYDDGGLVAHEVTPRVASPRASFGGTLQLIDHEIVQATSCPAGASSCRFLVTFWRANVPIEEKYGLYVLLVRRNRSRVLAANPHTLGYQFSRGDEIASYNTSWWEPGVVIADYALLPATDSEGQPVTGPIDIKIRVREPKTRVVLEAQSDHYAIDEHGRLLIESYGP